MPVSYLFLVQRFRAFVKKSSFRKCYILSNRGVTDIRVRFRFRRKWYQEPWSTLVCVCVAGDSRQLIRSRLVVLLHGQFVRNQHSPSDAPSTHIQSHTVIKLFMVVYPEPDPDPRGWCTGSQLSTVSWHLNLHPNP